MTDLTYGGNSNVDRLALVAMSAPSQALENADAETWHYGAEFDPSSVAANHRGLVEIIEAAGAEVVWTDATLVDQGELADAIFAYDPSLMTDQGAIVLRMGKGLRQPEAALHRELYERLDITVIGSIEAPGTVEGGDCFWIDSDTLAVGRGFRTNQAGIDQLSAILLAQGVEVLAYDLPYFHGPQACLHLMSLVSPIARDKALVYMPLLPTALYQDMTSRGIELVAAPEDEFATSNGLSLNVLALAPDDVVMIAGFGATAQALEKTGTRVQTFDGSALCLPCEGGPTCLTRPLRRLA